MSNIKLQKTKKYHIVYQTTNKINQMIYIGVHSTNSLEDQYIGSGYRLKLAIEKYGKESFERTILYQFNTPEEMFRKEKEIVNLEFLSRPDVYNIVEGGFGGFNKGTTGLKHLYHSDTKKRCAVHPNVIKHMIIEGWVVGRTQSSTNDTIWIHKDDKKKMINPVKLSEYIDSGWKKGLPKSPTMGKIWIYSKDLDKYTLCDSSKLKEKLSQGWIKKKWSPIKKGNCWINNGKQNLRIQQEILNKYLLEGWNKGMITSRWI